MKKSIVHAQISIEEEEDYQNYQIDYLLKVKFLDGPLKNVELEHLVTENYETELYGKVSDILED